MPPQNPDTSVLAPEPAEPPVLIIDADDVFPAASRVIRRATQSPGGDQEPNPPRTAPGKPKASAAAPDLRRTHRVTAYCNRGTTAAGVRSGVGQCAAPADIPFGSNVYIPALGRTFVVTDRTHARFRHNTVDLFLPSWEACREFGRRYLKCEFHLADNPPRYGAVRVPAGQN